MLRAALAVVNEQDYFCGTKLLGLTDLKFFHCRLASFLVFPTKRHDNIPTGTP